MIEVISMRDATLEEIKEYTEKQNAGKKMSKRHNDPVERTRAQVYATGNRWAIENFEATH